LQKREFIVKNGEQYFLDIQKVLRGTNFFANLSKVKFYPDEQPRKGLISLVNSINGFYPLTKPRKISTSIDPNNLEDIEKINPIFDLAVSPAFFSEQSLDYSIEGSRCLLHSTLFPLLVWSALFDRPFSKNICVHGFASKEGLTDAEEFYSRINAGIFF